LENSSGFFWKKTVLLLSMSRPVFWPAFPLIFFMGVVYGGDASFFLTVPMLLQAIALSFPACLFVFGVNDIYDHVSDGINPRKKGLDGIRLAIPDYRLAAVGAAGGAFALTLSSLFTLNVVNGFYTLSFFVLAFCYSAPPWRLKTRPPMDSIASGIIGVLAPVGMGYSFTGQGFGLPSQAYVFCFSLMGFHAYSTIADHTADKISKDRTFAVVFGKRAAAVFGVLAFVAAAMAVYATHIAVFFLLCAACCTASCFWSSEKMVRYISIGVFAGGILLLAGWLMSC
jgi:4-hydroxybenzoate polyprenyltransferase